MSSFNAQEICEKKSLWANCLDILKDKIPQADFNMWVKPLKAEQTENKLTLMAPNQHVMQWVKNSGLSHIKNILNTLYDNQQPPTVHLQVGSSFDSISPKPIMTAPSKKTSMHFGPINSKNVSNINPSFSFDSFIEGNSNQLARAATIQVAENPGQAYNPLFLYGGVGLGKTHLIHAMGNSILQNNPEANVLYLHSERFVADMIKALQKNAMNEFKSFYRKINCLLIDDIQFFC